MSSSKTDVISVNEINNENLIDLTISCAQKQLLNDIAKQEGFVEYKTKLKRMNNAGNYLGFLYEVVIEENIQNNGGEGSKIFLFMKIVAERMRKTFPLHDMYINDIFVYNVLSPILNKYQCNASIPKKDQYIFPAYYGGIEKELEETLVLENLTYSNYAVHDKFKCISFDYAVEAVNNLAKFHAFSYVLEKRDAVFFSNIRNRKGNMFTDYNGPERLKKQAHKIVSSAIKNLKNVEYAERIKNFCEDMCENIENYVKCNKSPALCHGDYKGNNLMIKYENDKIDSLVVIDYQLVHFGSPLNDLFYFIFGTTDSKFREDYLDFLIQHYYKELGNFLKFFSLHVIDIYPKEDFNADVKSHLKIGLVVATQVLPYILVSQEQAPDLKLENESAFEKAMRCPSEIFLERYNGIVEDFVKWGHL